MLSTKMKILFQRIYRQTSHDLYLKTARLRWVFQEYHPLVQNPNNETFGIMTVIAHHPVIIHLVRRKWWLAFH